MISITSIDGLLFRWNKLIQKPYEEGDERGLKLVQSILKPIMLRRTKNSTDKEGKYVNFRYDAFYLSTLLYVVKLLRRSNSIRLCALKSLHSIKPLSPLHLNFVSPLHTNNLFGT